MLIEKKTTLGVGDVAAFRIVTGEEIIGRVVSLNDAGNFVIAKPMLVQMQMAENNRVGLGFGPIMLSADDSLNFSVPLSQMIVLPLPAKKEIADHYRSQTSSLALPNGGLLS